LLGCAFLRVERVGEAGRWCIAARLMAPMIKPQD